MSASPTALVLAALIPVALFSTRFLFPSKPATNTDNMTARPPRPPRLPFSSMWTQFYPPAPAFTEKDLPDLTGKVYIVTGSSSGIGLEVARLLYSANARVYLAARNQSKASTAIASIKASSPNSSGSLTYTHLDLADLSTVKASADSIISREPHIHGLFNNAGVQDLSPDAPKTAQGYEIHFGVNVLGNFLFTKLLTPTLVTTAKSSPPGSVRVVWVSSMGLEMVGEKSRGITPEYLSYYPALQPLERYGISKAGNWLYAVEFAKRHEADGLVSVPCNPGHLDSELYRSAGMLLKTVLSVFTLYPSKYGAYTEVYCALSPDITMEKSGDWVVPWGRLWEVREDLKEVKGVEEGGNGHAREFWEWSEERVREWT